MALIAPSLLSANFLHLESDCRMLNESQADWYHLDVMDGRFVPNISFGPMLIDFFRKATTKYCDVHLMIEEPERYVEAFHKAGVAIKPQTPGDSLSDILIDADLVCIMSVNPGFGGQQFIPHTLEKVRQLRQQIDAQHLNTLIEVDGGVTLDNAPALIEAGAHVLVAGNTVFKSADPKATIAALKNC